MVDFRLEYQAQPGGPGIVIAKHWKVAQGRTVSPDAPLGWNQFTCHLTVEKWDRTANTQRVGDFHLSFKFWKGQLLAGKNQPGCKWLWSPAKSKFDFNGWFNVPALYLKLGEDAIVAQKVTAFVRARRGLLLIDAMKDPTMWASLQHAIPDTPAAR